MSCFDRHDKIICDSCGKHLDISELDDFAEFKCLLCGKTLKKHLYFERYILTDLCGIGGMSKVYRGVDYQTKEEFAIKINHDDILENNSNGERFIFEANLVAKINHDGIVKIFRGGIFRQRAFLVMEFMKKGNLESLQKNFLLPPSEKLLHWLSIIASGLYAAYKVGVVHHDVKPANIMLSEEGEVKIGDFDLAEMAIDGEHNEEATFASLPYVSPERLNSGVENESGDIFSLGVSAYELLTGEYPFGDKGTPEELLERRANPNFLPVNSLNSTISNSVSEIIERMISYNIEDRPTYQEIINVFSESNPKLLLGYDNTVSGKIKSWFKK